MERWKSVKGFEGAYEVSDRGHVRSLARITANSSGGTRLWPARMLSPTPAKKTGYCNLRLHANGESRSTSVHRLVAEAFVPNPQNKPEVNHKDSNRANNHAGNLDWMDESEQQHHAFKYGFKVGARGTKQWMSRLTVAKVRAIRKRFSTGESQSKLAAEYGVCQTHVSDIVTFKKWAWLDSPQVPVSEKHPGPVRATLRRQYEKAS